MDTLPEVLTRITNRLDALETRVSLLEHPSDAPTALPAPTPLELPSASALASSSLSHSGVTFAVVGKAMLGMAGAYLLRAVAESGSFPKLAVVALAIAYACTWLVWAVRVPSGHWFASTTYAGTSALIFAPMLWELTLRFKVLSPRASATLLAGFVITAFVLAWRRNLTSIVWVASLATAIVGIALLVATHDIVPYVTALLLLTLLNEAAAFRNRWLSVRPVVALATDLAVWTLLYIYSSPDRSLADYANLTTAPLLAPAIALFLIYGTSIALRTILLRREITLFEIAQAVITFLLAAYAVLHFASAGVPIFAAFSLALSIVLYAAIFVFRIIEGPGNIRVYSAWSLALFLLGSFLCLPATWLATTLGIAAIATTFGGIGISRQSLAFHGLAYLSAAAVASGLMQYSAHAVAGAFPLWPRPTVWIIAAAIILCYTIGGQVYKEQHWKTHLFQTLSAALAVGSAATVLVSAIVWLMATVITPGAPHVAVIRTLTACTLALALAWIGPRWHRVELVWLAYASLAAVAAKLLFEDLRQGHPEFIAASIFLYALTLILVPQIVRKSTHKWQPTPPS